MKKSNKTRFAILGMLTLKPMSGYDIKKAMDESTQHFWQESPGQIYPILAQLLKEKCVSCIEEETRGGRTRNIYKINAQGLKELKKWLAEDSAPIVPRNELLLKLFFGNNVSKEISIQHIHHYQKELENRSALFEMISKMIKKDKSEDAKYWHFTISYGQHITKAQLSWCKDTLLVLEK